MNLSTPDDDPENNDERAESGGEADGEISVTDPVTTEEVSVEEGLESIVTQMYDEFEAMRREREELKSRLTELEEESERRDHAIAELQEGFETLAEMENEEMKVIFEHDLRNP